MAAALTKDRLVRYDLEPVSFEEDQPRAISLFRTVMEVAEIDRFIRDLPSFPRVSQLIYREELVLAVGGTTAIEGNALGSEEILEAFDKADRSAKLGIAEMEVNNARRVYRFVTDFVDSNPGAPITEELIRQIHTVMTRDLPYPGNKPGAYRTTQVSFGIPRAPALLQTEAEVQEGMKGFVLWLNDPQRGSFLGFPLVKANLAHYYLTEIHPFVDGNGRTARALEAFMLYRSGGFNRYCFWSLANFFSRNRDEYLVHLRTVREQAGVTPFLEFSARGSKEELSRIKCLALTKVKKLMFMDYVHYLRREKKGKPVKINERIVNLLAILCETGRVKFDDLLSSPSVGALYTSVSSSTRRRDWKKMLRLNLVSLPKEGDVLFVEPNLGILEELSYRA
jgi:Fic family protein